MTTYISNIDSARFGFKIAKINDIEVLQQENFLQEIKGIGVKLIITSVPTENLAGINFLENVGFRIMDVQSTYKFEIDKQEINSRSRNPDLIVRDATESDVSKLASIGKESFKGYGHYFADNRLDRNHCSEIYGDWIRRSVIDNEIADKILVAEKDGEPAGFLSFKIYEENDVKYAAGGIGAVSSKFRRMNVFSSLTVDGLLWGKSLGLKWEEHNVLNTNYAVNGVFSKLGFTIKRSFITFHNWLD